MRGKLNVGVFPNFDYQKYINWSSSTPNFSSMASLTYHLCKYIASFLKIGFQKGQNSFEVVSQLKNLELQIFIMICLEVVSISIIIPTVPTKELVQEHYEKTVVFYNCFCLQKYGLGMGKRSSPTCSHIVMAELQQTCLFLRNLWMTPSVMFLNVLLIRKKLKRAINK